MSPIATFPTEPSRGNPYALPAAPASARCKVCGTDAPIAGVVDFSRGGADVQHGLAAGNLALTHDQVILAKLDPYVGLAIYYYACPDCGFAFTPSLDGWSAAEFAEHIYNSDYVRHDPGFDGIRQDGWAEQFEEWFGGFGRDFAIVDYGSGMGFLEQRLRARGFTSVASFDPFGASPAPLAMAARIIFLNEVIEHTTDPHGSFDEIARLLADDGIVLMTTQLVDPGILANGIAHWWYCAPRSGHVSFFSEPAMHRMAAAHGLVYRRLGESFHLFRRGAMPGWAAQVFGPA